jgi:DNA-binding transcriptional ArsR family regulator
MKTDAEIAGLFAALAHSSRIAILRNLLAHASTGRQFGEIVSAVGLSPSTLTHHLREMERAGVLIRTPEGRATRLRLDLTALADALGQLTRLCCTQDVAVAAMQSPLPRPEHEDIPR